jgi:hypothetical protein
MACQASKHTAARKQGGAPRAGDEASPGRIDVAAMAPASSNRKAAKAGAPPTQAQQQTFIARRSDVIATTLPGFERFTQGTKRYMRYKATSKASTQAPWVWLRFCNNRIGGLERGTFLIGLKFTNDEGEIGRTGSNTGETRKVRSLGR